VIAILLLSACVRDIQKRDFEEALKLVEQEKYEKSLELFDRSIKRNERSETAILAAKKAAEIADLNLKTPIRAIKYYHHLILVAPTAEEQRSAQIHLANLYFNQLADYERSVLEFSKLLDLPHSREEGRLYHFALAKSYFYLNQFFQARVEVENIEKSGAEGQLLFDALLLKGNIYLATKSIDSAIATYKSLIEKFPQKAQEEQILLNLALCYEEQKDFGKAIGILEQLKASYAEPQFIEVRIRKLKERLSLQPGAQGLKR
jgi:tetratricopeptide (TPR) repeat protein